jgi:hypothetical protein
VGNSSHPALAGQTRSHELRAWGSQALWGFAFVCRTGSSALEASNAHFTIGDLCAKSDLIIFLFLNYP